MVLKWYLPKVVRPIKRLASEELLSSIPEASMESFCKAMDVCVEGTDWNQFISAQMGDPYACQDPQQLVQLPREPMALVRELLYILRPVATSSALLLANSKNRRWALWTLALGLEVFALYPELKQLFFNRQPLGMDTRFPAEDALAWQMSVPETEERYVRLASLLYNLLREPFYSLGMQQSIDWLIDGVSAWRLLKPLAGKHYIIFNECRDGKILSKAVRAGLLLYEQFVNVRASCK